MMMKRVILFVIALAVIFTAHSQEPVDASDLSFVENLNQPAVPGKASGPIKAHMRDIKKSLDKHLDDVEIIRNGEVVAVTIPCASLFAPNRTDVKESGKIYLRPFLNLMKYPSMYKVLMAVHSDNTGETSYQDKLTEDRANSIYDFIEKESYTECHSLVPYGIGSDDPAAPNDSYSNRALNRRVEIYIVPEWQMIDMAKSGRLK